jgi:hypothetical protein
MSSIFITVWWKQIEYNLDNIKSSIFIDDNWVLTLKSNEPVRKDFFTEIEFLDSQLIVDWNTIILQEEIKKISNIKLDWISFKMALNSDEKWNITWLSDEVVNYSNAEQKAIWEFLHDLFPILHEIVKNR